MTPTPSTGQDAELRTFHNRLRKLLNIDGHQLVEAGVMSADDTVSWEAFSNNPWVFFIRADDKIAEAIWSIMEGGR